MPRPTRVPGKPGLRTKKLKRRFERTESEASGTEVEVTETPRSEKPLRRRKQRMIDMAPGRPAYEADLQRLIAPLLQRGIPVKVRMHPFRATCGACTRRGTPCRSFALKNGRCRLHGGLSTGPKSQEGWERTRAGYDVWRARQRDKA